HPAHDRGARADRRPLLHQRRDAAPVSLCLTPAVHGRAGILVVDERHVVADEHVVFDRHAFANEGVARDLDAATDLGTLLDLDERSDRRFVADLALVQVDEIIDPDVVAELDVPQIPQLTVAHSLTSLPRRLIDISAASRIRTTLSPA